MTPSSFPLCSSCYRVVVYVVVVCYRKEVCGDREVYIHKPVILRVVIVVFSPPNVAVASTKTVSSCCLPQSLKLVIFKYFLEY